MLEISYLTELGFGKEGFLVVDPVEGEGLAWISRASRVVTDLALSILSDPADLDSPVQTAQEFAVPVRVYQSLRKTRTGSSHATIALKARVPIKVISERLGHENPAFTLKQYPHVIPGMQAEAAQSIAGMVATGS